MVGDLTLTGKLDATPLQAVLSSLTLVPDENRAVTRLTGSATVDFGAQPRFTAAMSSGVLSMPPLNSAA